MTLRRARAAHYDPHPSQERFDPEFPVAMQCADCGKFAFGPGKHMAEAMREHRETVCPMRKTRVDDPHVMTILYPRA